MRSARSTPLAGTTAPTNITSVMDWQVAEQELEETLEQAAAFVRGGDMPGAVARARWARAEFARLAAELPPSERRFDELQARIEDTIREYERLLIEWQHQNDARHAAYLKRERAAIGADEPESPASTAPKERRGRRLWLTVVRAGPMVRR
jgi:hypothetical protein